MAGFVDGEGCITIAKQVRKNRPSPAYRAAISIDNTYREVLDLFLRYYDGQVYSHRELRKDKWNAKWADAYTWRCPIGTSEQFLVDLLPYLRVKKGQAEICLDFLRNKADTKQFRRANGTIAGSEGLDAAELERREAWHDAIRRLNSKGTYARSFLPSEGAKDE